MSFAAIAIQMSLIMLLVMGVAVAVLIAAGASACFGQSWFWKVAVGAFILTVAFVAKLNSHREEQVATITNDAQIAHVTNQYVAVPGTMYIGQHGEPAAAAFQTAVRGWVVVLCLFVIPLLAFLGIRRYRSNVGAGGFRSLAAAVAASLAFLIVGMFFMRSGAVHIVTGPDASTWTGYPPLTSLGTREEPIDELWDRLNAPRIQLSHDATQDHAHPAEHTAVAILTSSSGETASAGGSPAEQAAAALIPAEATEAIAESEVATDDDPASPPIEAAAHEPTPPRARPAWVGEAPQFVGNVQRVVVQAGPHPRLNECYEELRNEMRNAVSQHLVELVHESTGDAYVYVPDLEQLGITNTFITREILTDQYVEDSEASFGLTKTAWGLLEFNESANQNLLAAWKRYARRDRIFGTMMLAGVVLSLVGGALALLKIDTWTRGYYTKRLFLGVPAVIIGLFFFLLLANK